jgi:hypothetical protein
MMTEADCMSFYIKLRKWRGSYVTVTVNIVIAQGTVKIPKRQNKLKTSRNKHAVNTYKFFDKLYSITDILNVNLLF